jgi:Cys-tRNA(Pro)/Cys-tRNA(Cys) deacylase
MPCGRITVMALETPVTRVLSELGIPHTLHVHETPLRSLEQAATERGLEKGQIVRSLLFRLEEQHYILVLVAGPDKVNWPKLRKVLGVRRITTAEDRQVQEVTGYPPGGVSPIGLKQPLRILAARGLEEQEILSIGAGIKNAGIILRTQDLLRAVEVEFADLIEAE